MRFFLRCAPKALRDYPSLTQKSNLEWLLLAEREGYETVVNLIIIQVIIANIIILIISIVCRFGAK